MMEPMMAAEPPMMEPAMMPAEESSEMLETGHPEPLTAAMPEESMMEADMMDPMMPPMMAAMPMMSAEMMQPTAIQTMMPAESQEAGEMSDEAMMMPMGMMKSKMRM